MHRDVQYLKRRSWYTLDNKAMVLHVLLKVFTIDTLDGDQGHSSLILRSNWYISVRCPHHSSLFYTARNLTPSSSGVFPRKMRHCKVVVNEWRWWVNYSKSGNEPRVTHERYMQLHSKSVTLSAFCRSSNALLRITGSHPWKPAVRNIRRENDEGQ